ncbi:HlyD family secretion protein [Legionella cardiaca]|uniref:HlyD family efflux transporter periplasmic adaptor subunit n=1 Tax=Legionella cardiaca TaxID=1071983 RepID=A0ABY8ANB3_9GAMM|nr:HlyD family efflux transporter periplasmic adaptor subunit [Legionella cardiaca]WED42137.1 HlyD family efflux transporter periplasmic adaptor subunit [Legionella cardiaca]
MLLTLGLSGCNQQPIISMPGYVEGRYIYLSSLFAGTLKSLNVIPGMKVQAGQILFTLELSPSNQKLAIAKAKIQEATNQLQKANLYFELQKKNNLRNTMLLKKDIISKEEFENGKSAYEQALEDKKVAEARLISVQANEKEILWEMSQKTVTAPVDALVHNTFYTVGENLQADSPVLSLLDPKQVKIIFFVPQNLLGRIKINQVVNVSFDASKTPIKAKISYIADRVEYTPPVIYSIEERQKLVFRVEAKPDLDAVFSIIHPGQPVSITLNN